MKRRGALTRTLVAACAIALLVAAGGSSPRGAAGAGYTLTGDVHPVAGPSGSLTIDMGFPGTTIARNFNPWSPNATAGTLGFMYECLFGFNVLQGGKFVPWLGKSYQWSNGGKTITIDLDPRATWSDGSPVTASDVVFSLNDVQNNDIPASWKFSFASATAPDAHTVVINFDQPAYTELTSIGNVIPVPQKLWANQDGTNWTNPDPVASGPYKLQTFSPQNITLEARTDYWKQKVPVKTLYMPVTAGGESGENRLLTGQIEWSGGAVLNVKKVYVSKNPSTNHAWYPTYGTLLLAFNVQKAPWNSVDVRKGISLAINRQQLSQVANPGMFYPMNPTGLDNKTQGKWIAAQYKNSTQTGADTKAALAEFAKAGYHQSGGKLVGPDGKQLSFTIKEESDFGDSIQRDQVLASQLGHIGIAVKVVPEPAAQYSNDISDGDFDAVAKGAIYYNSPWGYYNDTLNSANAGSWANWAGWKDPQTDSLIKALGSANGYSEEMKLSLPLEKLMVNQMPMIPLISIGAAAEYSTKDWTGWPDAAHPYAIPAPWAGPPDEEETVLGLHPAH